jgi:hypothetical protein
MAVGTRRIRGAVRQGRYEFTLHALEEMDEDDLSESDVRKVLGRGRVIARLAHLLRIITVYRLES